MKEYLVETERLILRPFKVTDAESYFRITRDADIRKYVPNACPATMEECTKDIEEVYSKGDFEHDYYIIIEEKRHHRVIGAIICVLIQDFDVSSFIDRKHRGFGYQHEALQAFIGSMPKGGALLFKVAAENITPMWILDNFSGMENISKFYDPEDKDHAYYRYIL